MKKVKIGIILLFLLIGSVVAFNYSRLNIITGFAAKSVCSCTFEAGRDLESIESGDNDIDPVYYAKNVIDYENKSVSSTVFVLKKRTAVFKEGTGCVLLPQNVSSVISYIPKRSDSIIRRPYPYGHLPPKDTLFHNIDYNRLNNAISAFFDTKDEKIHRTRAVVVLYKGHIVAEKYAPGFDVNTKLLGWSMTKSITNAILGVMKHKGMITLDQSNLFDAWHQDNRSAITLNNLLQMNSGLEWVEDYNTLSDVTNMLFMEEDMTTIQLQKKLSGTPGNSWNYSSGTSNLLSGFIRDQFDSHEAYIDFWFSELIDKIGMSSMIIETDSRGNFVGSSYGWATARDWAKFGLLFLNEGKWNGNVLFDTDWTSYSATPTIGSNGSYGAHFWLNAGGVYPNVPSDLFSCNGYQGQHVFIIPSEDLVVVRMGLTEFPVFDIDSFLKGIIQSIAN
jgi:CubicO group peptidase (beta-lactamase class C family)